MCATCGCGADGGTRVIDLRGEVPAAAHDHHDHDHGGGRHTHAPQPAAGTETLVLEERVLARNDALAERNRGWLEARGIIAVNLMSSPGSGKTTLLERTVRQLGTDTEVCVVEGDQETTFDADRIKAAGAPVLQINTGAGCHLDASMIRTALHTLAPASGVILIENVGNLVCPAMFDLGEDCRVLIMSVTEGADKPLKYPHIFASATLILLNKIDLLPYVDFDVARFERDVTVVNPAAQVLPVSAIRGDGLDAWRDWLIQRSRSISGRPVGPSPAVGG
ncbi:MAG: hydrogenase nickel incorporation protein HypB [Frankiales bacterium]|nr:hydrogenase nickel incorporation protein HypB [Frankiales bacterium]